MSRSVRCIAVVACLAPIGCPTLGGYFCANDDDCNRGGQAGVCLVDNACGYPDPSGDCASGFVRSPNADRLPGECVPGGDLESGSGEAGSADDVADTGMTSTSGLTDGGSMDSDDGTTSATSCGQRVAVDIDIGRISPGSAVVGYPLYLRIDDAAIVGALSAAQDSLVVTDEAGVPLRHELQEAVADPDTFAAWVPLPSHDTGAILRLYVAWGGATTTPDPTAVWSDYVGVWHFDTAPNGAQQDQRPNAATPEEPGLTFGMMTEDSNVPGVVGGSLRFDGVDDAVDVPAAFVGTLESYSISMWARYEGETTQQDSYFQRLNGDNFWPRCWRQGDPTDPSLFCQWQVDGTTGGAYTGYDHANDAWMHFALQRDVEDGQTRVYADGQLVGSESDTGGALGTGTNAFQIGFGEWGSFPGTIDEVRVATSVIDPAWFVADTNHHSDPSAALEVGVVEPAPCG